MACHLLNILDVTLGRRHVIGQHVLVDVQGGQSECHLGLQLGRESLLDHVVTALHEQVVEGVHVGLGQVCSRSGHKGYAE